MYNVYYVYYSICRVCLEMSRSNIAILFYQQQQKRRKCFVVDLLVK